MNDNNSENAQKIPTNLVSKEERFIRMFFTYIRIGDDKLQSKKSIEKILLKDKKYNENIEKLKTDWITIYYNIYDYFISKEDCIYDYFYKELIYLCKEENDTNKELKNLVFSIMKICLKIYPPSKEDIVNFYHLFYLKDLNQNIFHLLMEIFNILYYYDKFESSYKEYFSKFNEKEFFLFDGNSHIEIKLDKEWVDSGFNENPKNDRSKTYYVLGFSFRYFKKYDIVKLAQIRFKSNKYLILAIKNGILQSNMPFKDNIQIPIQENTDYKFNIAFLKERIQIHINDTFYEISEGLEETAKNLIIGDKFFGLFYRVFSTFTFEPLTFTGGVIHFTHPNDGGKFHFFNAGPINVYESLNYPKKIHFIKRSTKANVNFSGRVLLFKTEKSYLRSLKNIGSFDSICILLMFFIYKPEFYKKEYVEMIFNRINENCSNNKNKELFANSNYFVKCIQVLCNYPKEIRDLELIDYISPLMKYSSGFNYYLDILKIIYGYEPEKNKQPFSFLLIEVIIKKLLEIENISQMDEIRDILLNIIQFFGLEKLYQKKDNVAEDIYYLILLYFENFKSPNEEIYFYVPYYFWFITLYIFFFEIKNKIKEIDIIYNQIKENMNKNEINDNENKKIINIINNYILLLNNEKVNSISYFSNEKEKVNYLYITYIFKTYAKFRKNVIFEKEINNNLENIKNIISKYKFEKIEDYKDKSISNFLIPCAYKLPYITRQFKKEENSLIIEFLFEDIFLNLSKDQILYDMIKFLKNVCICLKYTCKDTNKFLVHYIKNEIFKQLKKFEFKVDNSFYSKFLNDEEYAKNLNIDISNLFGDLYSKLESDKKDEKLEHEISETKLKEYFNPNNDLYQSDYLINNTYIDEIITDMNYRKNWIKDMQEEQIYFNQNWSDLDFCYNPNNKNPKFTTKAAGTNDFKYCLLYRIPNITQIIKGRNKKGTKPDTLSDLFEEEIKEPFPVCIHINNKEIKLNLEFVLKYREDLNKQIEFEYLFNYKKKYPCCILGSTQGKGFFYVKDEKTIEFANYYDLDKADHYDCLDYLDGITTDRKYYYNPTKIFKITIAKENIKMFFKRIVYYDDQGLEIFLFLGGSWYFVFKEKRDEFLEEAGLTLKEEKIEEKNKKDELYFFDSKWKEKYMFNILYNDLNYKSGIFSKSGIKEPIGYISKYFRFPDDNKYWENPCLSDLLKRWEEHKISTFVLLMYLNIISGRSIEDKSQNIIMPQLILLNNDNKIILRNLKAPMGQQKIETNEENLKRISYFEDLYKKENDKTKAYYYNSSVLNEKTSSKYLSLLVPFNQLAKNIFDDKNNILTSINKEIIDSLTNINNINESIPEFFYLYACLKNVNNIKDLKFDEVELPSCDIIDNTKYNFDKSILFILTLNKILESKEVNDTIGDWIDLIFGVDQHSEKLKNIYKPECYLNDKAQNEIFKNNKEIINNLKSVGTMPLQLFQYSKFNSLIKRKYIPLNLNFPVKDTLTISISNINENEI